jgi:hypothetical protein
MVDKLADVEVREVYYTDDGKMIEKVGAELRAIARAYTDAMDRSYAMATAAVKLNLAERYNDQLERNAELFAGTAAAARACSPSTCDPSGTCK